MSRDGLASGAYRALVRLYPRRFRDEYGADMAQLMREQCREESTGRVFARAVIDAAISIPSQHVEARMHRAPNRLVSLFYMVAAVAGLLVAILGGSERATRVVGLGVAIIAATIGAMAWHRSAPIRDTPPVTASWWKFLLAGPCLVALVIVAAGVGVNAWYLGMVIVIAAFVSTAVGVVLLLTRLFSHRVSEGTT
jgi:hypothetical protein